jgi:hypothetical protein|uniref:Uncharacterized protein n=1 Tax=Thermogladius calderae TaxID=1200300 RepID=A0A7J3XYR2_9CREN
MSDIARKKLVYVSEDVLEKLSRLAYIRGESLAKLLDRVLRQVIEAFEMGYNIEELVNLLKVVEVERKLGAVFIPHEALEAVLKDNANPGELRRIFYEAGRSYGLYIRSKYNGSLDIVKSFLEKTRWDLNEVSILQLEGTVRVICLSTLMSDVETSIMLGFIEGLMNGLGYTAIREEVARGIIVADFKPLTD